MKAKERVRSRDREASLAISGGDPVQRSSRPEGTIAIDERGRVVDWSRGATSVFGYEREEALGRALERLTIPRYRRGEFRLRFEDVRARPESPWLGGPFESVAMRSSGEQIPVEVRATRTDTEPPNFIICFTDLSAEPRDIGQRQLEAIVESSEDAMATLSPSGVITTWNPAAARLYGFSAEEVIGRRMASVLVPADRKHEPPDWLAKVVAGEGVEAETARLHRDGSQILVLVRMLPVRDPDGQIIGSVWIARDITDRRERELREGREGEYRLWQRRIGHALAEDRLTFAAQPIVGLFTGKVDHHELLLRMQSGSEDPHLPEQLIGVAERSGQIRAIDLWAAGRGIELAAEFPVSVNLSARSLASRTLLERIEGDIARSGVDPQRITFEITETAASEEIEGALTLTKRLRELGCGVALDDFGTGFGSLSYLRRLPITELKIDREFVRSALTKQVDQEIILALVAVARRFGMRTVAEGIEDERTADCMRNLGVDLAQGYHLGRPELVGQSRLQGLSWEHFPPPLRSRFGKPA